MDYFCCTRAVTADEIARVQRHTAAKEDTGPMTEFIATGGRFPIIMVTASRAALLDDTLKSLAAVRCVSLPTDVFVVQDGNVPEVAAVLDKHGVGYHQRDGGPFIAAVDPGARIAQHYGYTLQYAFTVAFPHAPGIILVEDDFSFSPDFYEYFHAVAPALESDADTLWVASAWHDNGFDYLVADPYALRRTRYFPGLGWLLPRRLWVNELSQKWPTAHWDHWMRDPAQHRGRDVVIPEISRDYHTGVTGSFMEINTHNRFFGSIAMQADDAFTWDTPEGADAIMRLLQPRYDQALIATLHDASTKHLRSVEEIARFDAGVGIVWYDCPSGSANHDEMRIVAQYFGIWHEGGRASREGVHELWWLGTAKLFLINVCDSATAPGGVVSGAIECSRLRALMPSHISPISWQAFNAQTHPQLGMHTHKGGVWVSVLAHLENQPDMNGDPDKNGGAVSLTRTTRKRAEGGEAHAGGEHPHAHKGFNADLSLPEPKKAVKPAGAAALRAMPAEIAVVPASRMGLSCDQVCAEVEGKCVVEYLPNVNDCATLRSNFPCSQCSGSEGRDQPAMIDLTAPPGKLGGQCLVNGNRDMFSCDGSWQYARRLCTCTKPGA